MDSKKHAIHPGYVKSQTDGDIHWITYSQLVRLYGLDPNDCVQWVPFGMNHRYYHHLYPRRDGNYVI
jgi:fatty acid desaturase